MDIFYNKAYTITHGKKYFYVVGRANGKTVCLSEFLECCFYYIRKKNHVRRWRRYDI